MVDTEESGEDILTLIASILGVLFVSHLVYTLIKAINQI